MWWNRGCRHQVQDVSTARDDAIHKNYRVSNSSIWATHETYMVAVSAYSNVLETDLDTSMRCLRPSLSHWSYTWAITTTHVQAYQSTRVNGFEE